MSATSEISYAWSGETRLARGVIRTIENLTGRPRLIRMARDYERDVAAGRDFWAVMQERYRIRLDFVEGSPEVMPASGPTVVVANHPFGILDGLALGRLMSMRRPDFKIVAHTVFNRAPEVARHILPISFDNTREARALNLQTRRDALQFLADGGAIAVFPGGCVSTAAKPFGRPIDPRWKNFTAKLAAQNDAQVVPLFFEGSNSRVFQAVSHLSQTLRYALLINEFRTGITQPVRIRLGEPMDRAQIDAMRGDAVALMDHLRNTVYGLSPQPFEHLGYGWNGE
jgi:putative hemolysin